MNLKDVASPFLCWLTYRHVAIKPPRPKQGRIEDVWTIGCSYNYYRVVGCKTIHFTKDLIKRLFPLVMATTDTSATLSSNSIDFIDKDNGWRRFFGLLEEIPYPTRADPYKHLNELRPVNREKWDSSFPGNSSSKQCLTCTRRPVKQDALWYPTAQLLEFVRTRQKLNDFLQI